MSHYISLVYSTDTVITIKEILTVHLQFNG
jgi:hypothetical protein